MNLNKKAQGKEEVCYELDWSRRHWAYMNWLDKHKLA
jgi:hypothetical protein